MLFHVRAYSHAAGRSGADWGVLGRFCTRPYAFARGRTLWNGSGPSCFATALQDGTPARPVPTMRPCHGRGESKKSVKSYRPAGDNPIECFP